MRPLIVPRALVMLAALWIFLAWINLFGLRPPVQPQAASYAPTIQLLFATIGVGIALAWPVLRLSNRPSSVPVTQALLDGVSLLVLLQVVLWPLRLVANWTIPRTVAVDAALGASIVLTAALLANAQGARDRRVRTMAMGCITALVLAPWIIAALESLTDGRFDAPVLVESVLTCLSAPALLARFSEPATLDPTEADRSLMILAWTLSAGAWIVLPIVRTLIARRPGRA